jgi:hypothetical protein
VSLAPFAALTNASVRAWVEAGEVLAHRANAQLERLNTMMSKLMISLPHCCQNADHYCKGDNESPAATEILHANQGLVANYQHAYNRYISASNDIAKIQNMLQMWRQINDPLTVLEQGMKKGGD